MVTIKELKFDDSELTIKMVDHLLTELRDDEVPSASQDHERLINHWKEWQDSFWVFAAYDGDQVAGLITLVECFAIYAGGKYGIIPELYVSPAYRSRGIGNKLLDTIKEHGAGRGWCRIDVTAPAGDKWQRTVQFYEREGFMFTGPKLKYMLEQRK